MKKFEYNHIIINYSEELLEKVLEDAGEKGWELVNFKIQKELLGRDIILIFKREK